MKEMRVLMITDNLRRGGSERRMLECIKGIRQHGNLVQLIILNTNNEYPEAAQLEIKIHQINRRFKKDPLVLITLFRICKNFRPSIIHSWGSMSSVYAVPLHLFLRIPFINGIITTSICPRFSPRWWRSRLTFPFSDFIIANSNAGLKAFHAPRSKSFLIFNGFDYNRINNMTPRAQILKNFNITSRYVVGMVATMDNRKDFHTYLRAADLVCNGTREITFLCVGNGPLVDDLKKYSSHNPNVIFTGNQHDVESIISVLDIGVLMTNTQKAYEGISNAILEYMAIGKPVIASSGGGTNEIVENNKTGFLIDSGSAESLAEKITYLIENQEIRLKMGECAKERIQMNFGFEKMVNSTIAVYQRSLKQDYTNEIS